MTRATGRNILILVGAYDLSILIGMPFLFWSRKSRRGAFIKAISVRWQAPLTRKPFGVRSVSQRT